MSLTANPRADRDVVPAALRPAGTRVALRHGVFSTVLPDGQLRLMAWPHAQSIGLLDLPARGVLARLASGPVPVADLLPATGHTAATMRLLTVLHDGGWLSLTRAADAAPLLTLHPLRSAPADPGPAVAGTRLSRFAVIRRDGDGVLLESPRSWCEVRIHDERVLALVGSVALQGAAPEPTSEGLAAETVAQVLDDLRWAGMLVPELSDEDTELRLRQWSPHELWFHDRSRLAYRGHVGAGYGGTWWAKGVFDPPPARPPAFPAPAQPLHRPDLDAVRRTDPSFTQVLEGRRSLREHDARTPVTAEQLGEFLYRCARVRRVREEDGVEFTSRPHASGGSVYEQEVYPVVTTASGLAPGMYHYDGFDHALRRVRDVDHPAVRRMLRVAAQASTTGALPQVLLVVSARVGRVLWKYEGMGYAIVLKNTGALYQTMSCVASAMGLAGCGLGTDDAAAFTEATGRDPLEECSVGQFILGSAARGSAVLA